MTEFFVPGSADAGSADSGVEAAYRRLAELTGAAAAPPGRRIRQVAFKVGRESWTAEVGRTMVGTRPEHRRRRGEFTTTTERLTGQATVLAIFAGTPFTIVTDDEQATSAPPALPAPSSESAPPAPPASAQPAGVHTIRVDKPSRVAYFAV